MLFICYPKCTTCQRAQRWLTERGVAYDFRDIKIDHPSYDELKEWHKLSGLPLKRFFNTSGLLYKQLGLSEKLKSMSGSKNENPELLGKSGVSGFYFAD